MSNSSKDSILSMGGSAAVSSDIYWERCFLNHVDVMDMVLHLEKIHTVTEQTHFEMTLAFWVSCNNSHPITRENRGDKCQTPYLTHLSFFQQSDCKLWQRLGQPPFTFKKIYHGKIVDLENSKQKLHRKTFCHSYWINVYRNIPITDLSFLDRLA